MPHSGSNSESDPSTLAAAQQSAFSFEVGARLSETRPPSSGFLNADGGSRHDGGQRGEFLGRTGTITTPHGQIQTPAFIAVGTKATVKAVLPESMKELGAQALLANAYHLYLQPGPEILDAAGGLGAFMNWDGPTFTDSGGFQVMSLGSGFKKVIDMTSVDASGPDDAVAPGKERLAHVDEDGVWFKSHLNGDRHRFSPEISMRVQHQIGADIMFAFDELTTLQNSRGYQEESLERTRRWAERCVVEHERLTAERVGKPYQALFGVIQGAQYEDLRRKACRDLGGMPFDGFGIGGALEKENLGTIVRWCNEELPENKPATSWASPSRTISSRPSKTVPTPSIASPPPAWPATRRFILRPVGSTFPGPATNRISDPCRTVAIATPAPTIRARISTTCTRPMNCSRTRSSPSTTSASW
ncbi:queuine tRNA-ribosyltransferase [Arthrobacter sp. Hiyo8]|nr:queuine tRNA-ribosyltransferase [Arthrobacter sp. Hiyo8]